MNRVVQCSLVVFFCLLQAACSSESVLYNNPDTIPHIKALQLYTARASLTDKSFEQYSLVKNQLYFECGQIHRKRNAVAEQKTETLSEEQLKELGVLLALVEQSPREVLPEPGHVDSMFGDGKFLLDAQYEQSLKVETELDEVSNKGSNAARALHNLYSFLRGIPQVAPCGKKSFYGVGTPIPSLLEGE